MLFRFGGCWDLARRLKISFCFNSWCKVRVTGGTESSAVLRNLVGDLGRVGVRFEVMHGNARQERDVTGPIAKDKEVVFALLGLAVSASVATCTLRVVTSKYK